LNPLWSNIFRKKPEEESLAYFLGTLPLFADLSPRELAYFEKLVHPRRYDADETVFSEGDPGSGIYMVRSGRVLIHTRDAHRRKRQLALLGPGDLFGETTLAAPSMRTASATTLEKSELIGLFRADLLETMQKHPQLGNQLLLGLARVMGERLQAVGQELQRLQAQLEAGDGA